MRPVAPIAAFLTGHSVRGCTGLSREQLDFQSRTEIPHHQWLAHNFPYHETFPFPEPVGLIRASLSNAAHVFESWLPSGGTRHRDQVCGIFRRHDAVILLAGSCGLELLNNLRLPDEILARIHVFAFGPVSRRLPRTASHVVVQGTRDFYSGLCHRRPDHLIRCAHMDYLRSPEALDLFNKFCRSILEPAAVNP